MGRKFIIDTDVGLDDASALFLAIEAHKAGAVEIIGITAVHGNTCLDHVVTNIARTLKAANLNQVTNSSGSGLKNCDLIGSKK